MPQEALVPSVVRYLPPLPVCVGNKALIAFAAVVEPVPPLAIGNVPVIALVELKLTAPQDGAAEPAPDFKI